MSPLPNITNCFGLYNDSSSCWACLAKQKCRAITTTHGLDILSDLLDQTAEELPKGWYRDSDRPPELIQQLREPPPPLMDAEAQMLGILVKDGEDDSLEPDVDI